MAPTPLPTESQALLDGTANALKMLVEKYGKVGPRWKKMAGGLKQGIADENETEISFYLPEFRKVAKEVDDAVATMGSVLASIANLRRDEAVMATRFDRVETMLKGVAPIRKQLLAWVDEARELDKTAAKAATAAKTSNDSADTDLAGLKDAVADLMKQHDAALVEAPKLEKAARDAFAAGKQKALTAARLDLIELGGRTSQMPAMRSRVERFRKSYPNLDRDQKAEAQWLLDDLQKMEDSYRDIAKTAAELVKLGQVPVKKAAPPPPPPKYVAADAIKIGKDLGLDPKLKDRLLKALNKADDDEGLPKAIVTEFKDQGLKETEVKAKLAKSETMKKRAAAQRDAMKIDL